MATRTELSEARLFMPRLGGGKRLLAAVSGGLDSMCLLRFLLDWTAVRGGDVLAAHFNHRLRGEAADRDEAFVRDWCRSHGVPFFRGEGDVRAYAKHEGLSVEEAARRLRYRFLERTAAAEGCGWILTAHHADDNAETMLLNLVRGTGSRGLSGIPAVRGNVARPFLRQTREELERYAAARKIPHVEDETNADPETAARNLLRQRVMPALRELNPQTARTMGRAAAILERENDFVKRQADALAGEASVESGVLRIPRKTLAEAHPAIAGPAALALLETACGKRRNLTAVDAAAVLAECRYGPESWELRLPHKLLVRGEGEELVISVLPPPSEPVSIASGQTVAFGGWLVTLDAAPGEGIALSLPENAPLTVTPWRSGDRMTLPGARGSRTLKRLCADAGVRPWQRDALPVLRAGGVPAAVPGVGIDAAFAPRPGEAAVYAAFYRKTEQKGERQT